MKQYYVYILANKRNGTLYAGITSDLIRRVSEHKQELVEGFSKKHKTHLLVWYEVHETAASAIRREKLVKRWKRPWKTRLIEDMNPYWDDLCGKLNG